MIKASYYRTLITPAPLEDGVLYALVSNAIRKARQERSTTMSVAIPRIDVVRARKLIEQYEYLITGVDLAGPEAIAREQAFAATIRGYNALDYVEDTIHFKIPNLPGVI